MTAENSPRLRSGSDSDDELREALHRLLEILACRVATMLRKASQPAEPDQKTVR